jgi:integrase
MGVVTQAELIDALRLISAHHNLEAIVTCTRRIFEFEQLYPNLLDHPIENLAPRLDILRRISQLVFAEEHFKQSHLPKDSPCPLTPFTGDSPICDLMLLNRYDGTQQDEFEKVLAWFVWIALKYHNEALSSDRYESYILSAEGRPKLSSNKYSGRIASAARHVRQLADSGRSDDLERLVQLDLSLTDESGKSLAGLAERVRGRNGIGQTLDVIKKFEPEADIEELKERLVTVRDSVASPMRYLWRLIWVPGTSGRSSPSHVSRQKQETKKLFGTKASRYGESLVHGTDAGKTLIVDVTPEPKPVKAKVPKEAIDDVDDEDHPPKDPTYRLVYEDTDDLVQGWYAAKGAQYAVEYQNAQLPWSAHRLSSSAVRELIKNVLTHQDRGIPEKLSESQRKALVAKRAGKVLVGLSLITGRSFEELRVAEIQPVPYRWKNERSIQVDIAKGLLRVKAGAPNLTKKARAKLEGSRILAPHGEMVTIKLPMFLQELIGDAKWLGEGHLRSSTYRKAAGKLIRALPAGYGFSGAAVRDALLFELLSLNKGDLGLVKVITDRNGLNYNNIIHYASFSESTVCHAWAGAVAQLIGVSPRSLIAHQGGTSGDLFGEQFLGTPEAIDEGVLREQIQRVQKRLAIRLEQGADVHVFNLMTLYTLLWLNLATGSRGRVNPSPVAIIGDTALISDKHRDDDSAERPVPLSTGVQAQLKAYVAYVWHLSLTVPQLQPLADSLVNGVLRFQFINAQSQVVDFRPKWLYESEALIPMPANWARKYIQASLTNLGGRIQNAMQGHWVLGRHPFRVTSNFCTREANGLWLEGQQQLEKRLGFQVVAHPKISEPAIAWPIPLTLVPASSVHHKAPAKENSKAVLNKQQIEEAFEEHAEELYKAICGTTEKVPAAVMSLILKVAKACSKDIKTEIQIAKDCCDYVRREWKVPIYVNKPRRQFQKDWLIKRNAIVNLAYLEQQVLPEFNKELAHLPPPDSDIHQVARLLMILMWRQGLTTWPVINQFIEGFLQYGIKATAGLRYVPAVIRCRRNGAKMDRLIYLEPYSAIYLAAERERISDLLKPLVELNPQQRRAKCQRLLAAYLKELAGVTGTKLLTTLLQASQQYHLLNGTPLLAAYAAGEFETHDLPENELRHLLGMPAAPESFVTPTRSDSLEQSFKPEPSELPSHDLPRNANPVREVAAIRSPDPNTRITRIKKLTEKGYRNRLLGHFATWLHQKELKLVKNKLPESEKQRYKQLIEVVGYSLFGFCSEPNRGFAIDESLLNQIHDGFVDHHSNVSTAEAFGLLRKCLRQRGSANRLAQLGIKIGDIEPGQLQGVLSKLVLPAHQRQVIEALGSARSGIGSEGARASAVGVMRMVGTYGLRRTEAINLRLLDVQKNLMRVQPYDDHTLKTNWSRRNLPVQYADKNLAKWLSAEESRGPNQLISPERWVDGSQFFDPLNKLIQAVTGDPSSHLHILRHTVASQLLLSVLQPAADFDSIYGYIPWLQQLLIPKGRLGVLLGNEGFSGHGIQAISAMLGHSHPTTTLRYYIHTVGIAHLAYLHTLPAVDLDRAFEYRIKSPATMRRRQREWRDKMADLETKDQQAHIHHVLKGLVDPDAETLDSGFSGFKSQKAAANELLEDVSREIYFERFELLQAILVGDAPNETSEDIDQISANLQALDGLKTAKRGSQTKRHQLVELDGALIPKPLPARSPTTAAALLCDYLDVLRQTHPKQFSWLTEQWRHRAQSKLARVRLDVDDLKQWSALPSTECVKPKLQTHTSPRKKQSEPRFHQEHYGRLEIYNEQDSVFGRSSSAFRWVMTWVCIVF